MKLPSLTIVTAIFELLLSVKAQPFAQGLPAYCYGANAVVIPACAGYGGAVPAVTATPGVITGTTGLPIQVSTMVNLNEVLSDDSVVSVHQGTSDVSSVLAKYSGIPYSRTEYDLGDADITHLIGLGQSSYGPAPSGPIIGGSFGGAFGGGFGGAFGGSIGGSFGSSFGGGSFGTSVSDRYTISASAAYDASCCCCCCETRTEIQIQPVPVPVGIPEPVPQPPVIIEKIIPPLIITTTTTGAPIVTSTQIIVKETLLKPITSYDEGVLEATGGSVTVLRPTTTVMPIYSSAAQGMFQPLPLCVPTGNQFGQIQNMLYTAGQTHLTNYNLLYAQRNVGSQLECSIALQRPSGICEAYHLQSPLNQNAWSLGSVNTINCPTTMPLQLPYCNLGAF